MHVTFDEIFLNHKDFTLHFTTEIPKHKLSIILGASGSGKSTILKILAGLETRYKGSVRLGSQKIDDVPTHKRKIGMVFQDYALFPHLNVEQNIAYGILGGKNKKETIAFYLDLLDLRGFEKRSIEHLSGGEKQRIAIARALAAEPDILLLDEPLSALDADLRKRMRGTIKEIQKKLNITMLYVTHDQEEALAIADHILIIDNGRLIETGTAERLYNNPDELFTACFLGDYNLLYSEDKNNYLYFRPHQIEFANNGTKGIIKEREFRGKSYFYSVQTDEGLVLLDSQEFREIDSIIYYKKNNYMEFSIDQVNA